MSKKEYTSRERVLAVFEKKIPDRVPMWCGMSTEFIQKVMAQYNLNSEDEIQQLFHTDFRRVYSHIDSKGECLYEEGIKKGKVSIFGSIREGIGWGLPSSHPLEDASIEEIHAFPWPKPEWYDVSKLQEDALSWDRKYAILGGEWCPYFHDAIDLLGMETFLIKMYEEPELVHAVLNHIVDFYYEVCKKEFDVVKGTIDIFFLGNDFGSQTGPIIGEELFLEFIAPHMKRLCDLAHAYGIYTMLHCCGSYTQLMPILISCGVDAVQALQPITANMCPTSLLETFGNSIIFNGCIDSIRILINGNPELVDVNTKETLTIMKKKGNYILSASHDSILQETPIENVIAMFEAGLKYGVY